MKLVTFEMDGRMGSGALHPDGGIVDLTDLGGVLELLTNAEARMAAERRLADPAVKRLTQGLRLRAPLTPRAFI